MAGIYAGFAAIGAALVLARPAGGQGSARDKLPSYLVITAGFILAAWVPPPARVFPVALLGLGLVGWLELLWVSRHARHHLAEQLSSFIIVIGSILTLVLWSRPSGGLAVTWIYLVVAANDAFAQSVGERWGRTALAPRISPNKTVEGALGGILAGTVIGTLCGVALGRDLSGAAGISAVAAMAAMAGDLLFSGLKRRMGISSFGGLLGPHGGILDRFDSFYVAAIAVSVFVGPPV
jgi:phosphatidate cytidylyltransferase